MSILEIDTVSFDEATRELVIIDQTLLPGRLELMRLNDAASIREAIRRLCVRGAPAIGVAAALGLYACALRGADRDRAAHGREPFLGGETHAQSGLRAPAPGGVARGSLCHPR